MPQVERREIRLKTESSGRPSTFRTGGKLGEKLASQQQLKKYRFLYRCQVGPLVNNMSANANRLEHVADIHTVYCYVPHRQTATGANFGHLFVWFGNFWFLLVSNNVVASTGASFPGCRWLRNADSPTRDSDNQRTITELPDTPSYIHFKSDFQSGNTYSRSTSTKSPSFCMTTPSARLTNLTAPPHRSRDCSC